MRNLNTFLIVSLTGLLLAACGGGGDGDPPPIAGPDNPPVTTPPDGISGVVVAPDSLTPVAGATIFVAVNEATAQDLTATSGLASKAMSAAIEIACPPPTENYLVYTCSKSDGSFVLDTKDLSATEMTLSIKKSFFSKTVPVTLENGIAALGNVALPADPAAGAARFAVVQGLFDRMEDILAKMGMGQLDMTTYQLVPGSETFALLADMTPLFMDADADGKPDIYQFDVVFINCGQISEIEILANATYRQVLADYVTQGGVLYVTDQAYDFVEQVFPDYIDFLGEDAVPANTPEGLNQAQLGFGNINVTANVGNSLLSQWLATVTCTDGPCVNPDGTVAIAGFLSAWTVFNGSHAAQSANVTSWVNGPVSWFNILDPTSPNTQGDKPLTVTLKIGNGKVLFSSYHTDELLPSAGFHPQERILQYLVFEL